MATFEFNWRFAESDYLANLEKWWKGIEFRSRVPESDSGIASWLADFAGRYDIASCYASYAQSELSPDNPYHGAATYSELATALNMFDPRVSRVNGADQIIIYESAMKREAGKRLALNPGKAIRRIIPTIPDRYLEKAVDEFRVKFDSSAYEIKWGETRAEFKFAYSGENYAQTANVRFSDWRKSLANSCMRYDFRDCGLDGVHPAEVYASGDFRILTAIQKETGKVAARCVVRIDESKIPRPEYHHAPIYTANDNAADLLESALSEVFAEKAGYPNRDFDGARLLNIKCNGGIVAPYQDIGPARIHKPDSGDEFLTLSDRGELAYGCTRGYIRFKQCECSNCGEDCDPDYVQEIGGYFYCDECYSERFGMCEECEDSCEYDDMQTCYSWNERQGRVNEMCVCNSCRANNYTEITTGRDSGDYWRDDSAMELHDGETISARDYWNGDYFTSDHSGEIFDYDDRVETEDGDSIAQCEAEELGLIELPSGDWGKPDAESLAQLAKDATGRTEMDSAWQEERAGQFYLPIDLPRGMALEFDSIGDIEFPTANGLAQWAIAESVALIQFPDIGKICRGGESWYYFTDWRLPGNDDQTREFAILAECVSAYQSMKG